MGMVVSGSDPPIGAQDERCRLGILPGMAFESTKADAVLAEYRYGRGPGWPLHVPG